MLPTMRFVLCLVVIGVVASRADAQRRRFQPARPTLSPYLNLLPFDDPSRPNYQLLVQPQFRQREINQETARLLSYQSQKISELTEKSQELEIPATGTHSVFRAPGRFRQHSHYYPRHRPPGAASRR